MVIVFRNKNSFQLPFLTRDNFTKLVRSGVGYDKQIRTYNLKDRNTYDVAVTVLSEVLKDEVCFLQTCTYCGRTFACKDQQVECEFYNICDSRCLPMQCICDNCRKDPTLYKKLV